MNDQGIYKLLIKIVVLLFSVIMHEYSHGWMAERRGDPTARMMGRLTFNPIRHIDPIGSIFFPLMLALFRSPIIFGWAKPVPVNFFNLRRPKQDTVWVSVAGPASNLALAIVCGILFRVVTAMEGMVDSFSPLPLLLAGAVVINVLLAVFNLIPIPPLDGSKILTGFLPARFAMMMFRLERYGMVFIMLFMLLVYNIPMLGLIFSLPVALLTSLFAGPAIGPFIQFLFS